MSLLLCLPPLLAPAALPAQLPTQSDRVVSYRIEATLHPSARMIQGRETITWRNESHQPVGDLWFHLYLNAYKNNRTTLMREAGPEEQRRKPLTKREWSWIDVEAIRTAEGEDLKPSMEFVRPDDANPDDETVMRVTLPAPVPPAGSVSVEVAWTGRFPEGFTARNQAKDDFFMGVQWFPKLGVFEEERVRGKGTGKWGWNCHQFHASSEFYADYGAYDVSLTFPSEYRGTAGLPIGASGELVGEPTDSADGKSLTVRYRVEDVHDFAWTADPDFVVERRTFEPERQPDASEEERIARALGRAREEIALSPVKVTLLLQPEHADQADRHFRAVFAALYYFGLWYGRYPYPTLTVVDPPYGSSAGGMEYPTLITGGTDWLLAKRRLDPEGVLVHEFGHQFWFGLVGNNEFEHAWLDEGFNTYSTSKVLEHVYGAERATVNVGGIPLYAHPILPIPEAGDERDPRHLLTLAGIRWKAFNLPIRNDSPDGFVTLPGLDLALLRKDPFLGFLRDLPPLSFLPRFDRLEQETLRARYLGDPKADPMDRRAWQYVDRGSYGINSYPRPAVTLLTLERLVNARRGAGTWERVMRAYHERFRFRHPVPEDFLAVANEVSGLDLTPFFERAVHGSDVLDYGVRVAESKPQKKPEGVFGLGAAREERRKDPSEEEREEARTGPHDTKVVVQRFGEFVAPVEIEVKFAGRLPERFEWDGEDRHWTKRWEGGPRLEWVRVDPERIWLLDADLSNNERRVDPKRAAAARWGAQLLFQVQNALHFFGGIG